MYNLFAKFYSLQQLQNKSKKPKKEKKSFFSSLPQYKSCLYCLQDWEKNFFECYNIRILAKNLKLLEGRVQTYTKWGLKRYVEILDYSNGDILDFCLFCHRNSILCIQWFESLLIFIRWKQCIGYEYARFSRSNELKTKVNE